MSKNFELMQEERREMERVSWLPISQLQPQFCFRAPKRFAPRIAARRSLIEWLRKSASSWCSVFSWDRPRTSVARSSSPEWTEGMVAAASAVEAARILAANTSGSICLVDANFRNPSLSGFFGVPDDRGLADSLIGEGGIRSFAKQLTPSNLWLLSAGDLAPESPSLLNSESLKLRLQELRSEFDYVLIDAPALNLYSDAIALGRMADGVVVVLQADSTRRESALKGLQSLRDAHIEVLGAVLNRRTFPIPEFVYRRL